MVKVTFEQDGLVEDVTSGEFVLAVINTPQKQSDGRGCILGQATDKDITLALEKLVEKTVNNAVSPEACDDQRGIRTLVSKRRNPRSGNFRGIG